MKSTRPRIATRSRHSRSSVRGRLVTALCLASSFLAASSAAAPEYALSGRADELEKSVLATLPDGALSALDISMFDSMGERALWAVPMDALLAPASLSSEPHLAAIRAVIERLVAERTLALQAGDWRPAPDRLRVMSFGAAASVWIDRHVMPGVEVRDADVHRYYLANASDYLNRRMAQVRYIFRRTDLQAPAASEAANRDLLARIALQVNAGVVAFEDAAREYSDAPSARTGGLLPPFSDGTYFEEFDDETFAMDTAGQLSNIFADKNGLYLIQLVAMRPPRNVPIGEVENQIRERLRHDHVRSFFAYELNQLSDRVGPRDFSYYWPYQHSDAPVALVGGASLGRQQMMRYYPDPTDANYQVQWDIVIGRTREWVEGEMIMQELERLGWDSDPRIERALGLAAVRRMADHVMAVRVPRSSFDTVASARRTLESDAHFSQQVRAGRLIQFRVTPNIESDMPESQRRAALRLTDALIARLELGELAVEPRPIDIDEWWRAHRVEDPATFERSLEDLKDRGEATEWENVRLRISDIGWQTPLPGSVIEDLLAGREPGDMTQPVTQGDHDRVIHLVMDRAPIDMALLEQRPLMMKTLAYRAGCEKMIRQEVERLYREGGLDLTF